MYNIMTAVNFILYIWKLLGEQILKILITRGGKNLKGKAKNQVTPIPNYLGIMELI